jgi:hypothetical protein
MRSILSWFEAAKKVRNALLCTLGKVHAALVCAKYMLLNLEMTS